MTQAERIRIEILAEDCQQAAVRLAEAMRIKAEADAQFADYVRGLEEVSSRG